MKFAHLGDCHLGGWRQPELMALNLESFHHAIDQCIKQKVDFVLVAGDLFDSAYPPIEIVKEAFHSFRKLKEANIPVFIIAGSHDYSASGKTFLDVLEKAGFAQNVHNGEERDGKIVLQPTIYKNIALYGYPGRKSGLEVEDVSRIKLQNAPGLFRILMLHTTIRDAIGSLPIPAVDQDKLPEAEYYALGHLHINYHKGKIVYCGPTFPNNSEELEELKGGSFYIVTPNSKIERQEIVLKNVLVTDFDINNAFTASEKIISGLKELELKDKILIIRVRGTLTTGTISDISFNEVEDYAKKKEAYVILKSTSKLYSVEAPPSSDIKSDSVEEESIRKFAENDKTGLGMLVHPLLSVLQYEKKEEEKSQVFEGRIFEEVKKIIEL